MTVTAHTRVRATVAAGLCACAAGLAVATAPAAAGAVTGLKTLPNLTWGIDSDYGTGCTATIQAFVTDPVAPVYFYDNGIPLATVRPTGGVALVTWVPATPGMHRISAGQAPDAVAAVAVDVWTGVGTPVGYGCVVTGA